MNYFVAALILFLIGLIMSIVTAVKYFKQKKKQGDDFSAKPFAVKFGIVIALFVIAQILLILNK